MRSHNFESFLFVSNENSSKELPRKIIDGEKEKLYNILVNLRIE